ELAKLVAKGKPPKDDRWKAKYVEPEPVDESEVPELPEGWCWATVDQLFTIRDELRVPLNSEARATRRGQFPYYGANGLVDHIDDYRYEGKYILVAEDGGYFDEPARGVAYLVDG